MTPDRSLALDLARHVCGADLTDFPPATIHKAKLHILDTLGAGLAGSASPEARIVRESLGLQGEVGRALAWGMPLRLTPRSAGFINGVSAHAFELDDSGGCDHSGAVVVPAALALLADVVLPVSGRDLLRSILMGYEVGRRVLEAAGGYEAHNGLGWHSTGTCGVFGATATAGLLLGLGPERLAEAFGIACSFSGGTWGFIHDGSQTKKLHAGFAAQGGVTAALLAAGSFQGPSKVFDADAWGSFFKTFTPGTSDPTRLTSGFGENWRMNRCSIKPYATCRGTHSAIDAVRSLMARHAIRHKDVAVLEARMSGFQFGMCGGLSIASRAEAQMSLPYALAAEMQFGKVGLAELEIDCWSSSAIRFWLGRITVRIDSDIDDADEPAITIVTEGGRRYTETVSSPYGSPDNPLPDEQLIGKFFDLASGVLPSARLSQIRDEVLGLDEIVDARSLPELLQ